MNLRVHVDRLVLDGVPVEPHAGPKLQAAVEAELTRLLAAEVPPRLFTGAAVPVLRVPSAPLPPDGLPSRLGVQVARALYRSLSR
jgi:hypothetical protein